jgi:hypothetical protein
MSESRNVAAMKRRGCWRDSREGLGVEVGHILYREEREYTRQRDCEKEIVTQKRVKMQWMMTRPNDETKDKKSEVKGKDAKDCVWNNVML